MNCLTKLDPKRWRLFLAWQWPWDRFRPMLRDRHGRLFGAGLERPRSPEPDIRIKLNEAPRAFTPEQFGKWGAEGGRIGGKIGGKRTVNRYRFSSAAARTAVQARWERVRAAKAKATG